MHKIIKDETYEQYSKVYADRVDRAMEYRHMSNQELGKKAGVTSKAVSAIRNGTSLPSFLSAIRITLALGVSMDWLLGRAAPGKASKTGRWIEDDTGFHHCSRCGHRVGSYIAGKYYCENCGARNMTEL